MERTDAMHDTRKSEIWLAAALRGLFGLSGRVGRRSDTLYDYETMAV